MATLKVALTLASQQFTQGIAAADRQLENFAKQARQVGADLDNAFSRAGQVAAGLTAALTALTAAAAAQADEIVDLSRAYDTSIGSVYELGQALQQSGGESASAGKLISEFNKSILEAASGNLKTLETFNKLGVSLEEIGRLSDSELRDRVLAGLADIPDSATRSATAMQIFGKAVQGVSIEDFVNNLRNNRGQFDNLTGPALAAADAIGKFEEVLGQLQRAALVAFEPLIRAVSRITLDFDTLVVAIRAVAVAFAVLTGAAVIGGMVKLVSLATTLGTVLRRNPVVAIAGLALQLGAAAGLMSVLGKESEDSAKAVTEETKRLQESQKNITRDITGSQKARNKELETVEKQRAAQEALELQARTTLARQRAALQDIADNFALSNQTQIQNLQLQERGLTITSNQLELENALEQQRQKNANAELSIRRNFEGLAEKEQETNRAFYQQQLSDIQRNGQAAIQAIQGQIRATQYLRDVTTKFTLAQQEFATAEQRLFQTRAQQQIATAQDFQTRIDLENRLAAITRIREGLMARIAQLPATEQAAAVSAISGVTDNVDLLSMSYQDLAKNIQDAIQQQVTLGQISVSSLDTIANGGQLQAVLTGYRALADAQREIAEQSRTFAYGWNEAFRQYADSATNGATRAKEIFGSVTRGLEDSIINFVKTGKLSFKDLVNSIIETILRSQLQQLFASLFAPGIGGGGGGGLFGKLFAGFFADGGRIPSGQFGVVGEAGPELVGGPATVTPLNGGVGVTNVTYNISATDAASFQQLIARDPEFLFAVTEQGRRRLPNNRR